MNHTERRIRNQLKRVANLIDYNEQRKKMLELEYLKIKDKGVKK